MVVRKAKDPRFKDLGLVDQKFHSSSKWRLACIHDASAPSKQRDYAQEGVLALLTEDRLPMTGGYEIDGEKVSEELFGGRARILWSQGTRSKRISYSTSHGETLAAINGLESASLVALRVSELLLKDSKPSLQQLAALQERGNDDLPIDHYTDCRDLFELVTGGKSLPQDKAQRIYTLALKEARLCGRIRWFLLIPTEWMTADPLTKPMFSAPLLHLLSSGVVQVGNVGKHFILGRCLPKIELSDDTDLEYEDARLVKTLFALAYGMTSQEPRASVFFILCSMLLPTVTASSTTSGSSSCSAVEVSNEPAGWSSEVVFFMIWCSCVVSFPLSFVLWSFCWCCHKNVFKSEMKIPKRLMNDVTEVPKPETEDLKLHELVKTQECEITKLKHLLECKADEIERIYHESFVHNVVITGEGTRWHRTKTCRSVQISSAYRP